MVIENQESSGLPERFSLDESVAALLRTIQSSLPSSAKHEVSNLARGTLLEYLESMSSSRVSSLGRAEPATRCLEIFLRMNNRERDES